MIQIKCGSKTFTISEDNLKKSEYFVSELARWTSKDGQQEIALQVDQDPRVFRHFLNSLRSSVYHIPGKYKANVYAMFDFYGVKFTKLEQIDEDCLFKATSKTFKFVEMSNNIISCPPSPRMITECGKSSHELTFNGKLMDICPQGVYRLKSLRVSYNEKCILATRDYLTDSGFKQDFKKYLDGLVGQFVVKIKFNSDNMYDERQSYDAKNNIRYCKKESWCRILYFKLIDD